MSLQSGRYLPGVKGTYPYTMEEARFKHSPRSLFDIPHFWFTQLGWDYTGGKKTNPAREQARPTVKNQDFEEYSLLFNAGIGVGPLKAKDSEASIGYNYFQDWVSTQERMNTYRKDPIDFLYLPFRPDLMERTHQLFIDMVKAQKSSINFGVYGEFGIKRVGSTLYEPPEQIQELRTVLNVSKTTYVIPWITFEYLNNFSNKFHLYFKKEIQDEDPTLSNQSYSLFDENEETFFSFGLQQTARAPAIKTIFSLDLVNYQYIFNDLWEDHKRMGFILRSRTKIKDFIFLLGFGMYEDDYQLETIKTSRCDFEAVDPNGKGVPCRRKDNGILGSAGIRWNIDISNFISGHIQHKKHTNTKLKVYDRTQNKILIMFTHSFPTAKRSMRYINQFQHASFDGEIY